MAYNLQSLINILEQILDPKQTRWNLRHKKTQLQSLHQKAASLQQILEKSSLTNIENLETRIRISAHKAEDIIESNMVERLLSNSKNALRFTFSRRDLQQVMRELDYVMKQVAKLIKEKTISSGVSSSHDLSSTSIVHEDHLVRSKVVVGLEDPLLHLKDRVMGMQSKLEIVPIVGMGGIGKTTLARKLYQDPAIVEHFTSLAWTTVSQDYNIQAILTSLLRCVTGKESNVSKDILYRSLYGRRYLIVLDDVWSTKFWNEIRMYFPENNNGSRIVITTRESNVVKHANSHGKQHHMQLLSESASWVLLHQEVFRDEEDCPAALETIGRSIARNCGGLPLAICVIGGLLSSKANRTQGFWENVRNDVRAAIVESDGQFSDILSLSYNHLPSHLRPCFLYMGAFHEDYEIKASRLIRLMVAEGFLKPNGDKSLEKEAEDCLRALVARNLVSVTAVKSNGRGKRYNMHDLMRDMCLKKAEEQRFVHVGEKQGGDIEGIRRVSIHPPLGDINVFYASGLMPSTRSFLFMGFTMCRTPDVLLALKLLRVLDLLEMKFFGFPIEILQIVNLRYLVISCSIHGQLSSDISRLCNLQTLVISSTSLDHSIIYLPREILQMAELRHLVVYRGTFSFRTRDDSDWGGYILDKLQTVFPVNPSQEFLHRIPNVKKLGIIGSSSIYDLYDLHKLETLRFSRSLNLVPTCPSVVRLPPSLKKLSLTNCKIVGDFMNYLCELPNLEVLKLHMCDFECGEPREWDATQQEFGTLKFVLLDRVVNLVNWKADETNFPKLCHLVIQCCPYLEEIPFGIGEIPTLQIIQLGKHSRPSLVASAKLIIEEQRDNGNNDLQLRM